MYDYNPKQLQTHQLYGAQANKILRMSKKNAIAIHFYSGRMP